MEWVYTDDVSGLELISASSSDIDFALDLLTLADQYLVEALKRRCELAIQKSITVDNVAVMFGLADSRQALELRRRCFDYIILNFGQVGYRFLWLLILEDGVMVAVTRFPYS
jgi:hypothetical protein